jgi:putative aldouronate transport system permease protein
LGIVIPITLAVMMSLLHSSRKSKVYQTMMFFPHFMSWVVIAYFAYAFLSPDKGIINMILTSMGKEKINWYMEAKYWPFILIFMQVWKTVGYGMVVYLASITGIDGTLYEAAVIDGANKWQQVKFITLPSLKTVAVMMFILNVGRIFYSDFGLFYQIPRGVTGSLYNSVSTLDTYVYNALQTSSSIGMTAAATFFQSVACCITILAANWVVKKIDNENAII